MADLQEGEEEILCNPEDIKNEIFISEEKDETEDDMADKQISEDEFGEDMDTADFDENVKTNIVSWTQPATMRLIHYYKKYRPLVGTGQVKNLKRLFEIISQKVSKDMKSSYTPNNCENRWRVLQRKYKKYLLTSKTNKRARFFEFAKDMAELVDAYYNPKREEEVVKPKEPEKIILGPKLLLYPNVLLNSQNANTSGNTLNTDKRSLLKPQQNMSPIIINPSNNNMINKNIIQQPNIASSSSSGTDVKCKSESKTDKYYERKLDLERERLDLKKRQLSLYKEYQQKKLDEKIRKNELLEERNQILREYLRNNVNIPQMLT